MKTLMLAGLLAGLSAMPGRAAEPAATYDATVGARFVNMDSRWNKQQAMEYDGKQYNGAHGDVSVSNTGELGLFDFSLKDIGSTEEMMNFAADYKSSFKASAKWETMHHRMNPLRQGQIVNGVWRPNNIILTTGADRFNYRTGPRIDFNADPNGIYAMIKRTESEVNLGLFDPENAARWISLQYWSAEKTGIKYSQTATDWIGQGNVDNLRTDITVGLGTSLRTMGAMSLDFVFSKFQDNSEELKVQPANVVPILPRWSDHEMLAAEMRWKLDPTKKLSLTGGITGRQRENLINQYKINIGVLAVNAAYRASDKLSLIARVYTRYHEIDENPGFKGFNANGATGNTHEFDKLTMKGELTAAYHPTEKLHGKATYKIEMNHRRDAPSQRYLDNALYADGLFIAGGQQANNTTNDDVTHILDLRGTVELPKGMEIEGGYKKKYANRPVFINMPTRSEDFSVQFMAPLPANFEFIAGTDYTRERNANEVTNYHMSRNFYHTGLDWEKSRKLFAGVDASYETVRYTMEQYYQIANNVGTSVGNINLPHEGGAVDRQKNTTVEAHARVNLPAGFAVMANGSYTWSIVQNPVNFGWPNGVAGTGVTPVGTFVNDIQPSEVRVTRGAMTVEYTPPKYKNLTARASYAVTDWVDKIDPYMSGKARLAQVGASMKF